MNPDTASSADASAQRTGERTGPGNRERRANNKKGAATPRAGRLSSGLALILAVIAIIGTGYLWYTLLYERQELLNMDVPGTLTTLDQRTQELQQSLTDTEDELSTVTDTQETLKTAVEKIQNELGRNRAEWIVAEAEQLLLIANRRLQLARDVSSALAALRAADRSLELLANPNLLPVRRALAREITALESVEKTDIAGLSLRLGSLAETVEQLPLVQELRSPMLAHANDNPGARGDGASDDARAWSTRTVWRDILSLVRIRRHDALEKPLLPAEQQYFIRENLRLMLYGAQRALLQGYVSTYQQNLKTAGQWLNDYFDGGAQNVVTARTELDRLRATPVMTELPDISTSLEALRRATGRRAP